MLAGLFLLLFELHSIRSQRESRSLRSWDNSTNEYYCTAFVIFESHYSSLLVLAVSVLVVSLGVELSLVSGFSALAVAEGFFPL